MQRIAVSVLVLIAVQSPAHAESDGHVILAGLSTSRVWHEIAKDSVTLGAEVSIVFLDAKSPKAERRHFPGLDGTFWWGGYVDLLRDFGRDTTRLTLGPEAGYTVVGADGGLLLEFGDKTRTGFVIRPVLTAGIVTLFYRYGHYFDSDPDNRFHELGVLVKWGLPFYKKL
jgi:hypothetical protein